MRLPVIIVLLTFFGLSSLRGIAQNTCTLTLLPPDIFGASCSSSCDGSVVLHPSGGTAPYSYNAFEHTFPGSSIDLSLFEVRNGNFSVSGNQLIAQSNAQFANDYDNSITTIQSFPDNGKIVVEGSFYIDYNTYGNFGLAETNTITEQSQLPYSFFFSYGTLYIMDEGNQTQVMNYSSSTWYDFKIEKTGNTVNYYVRSTGLAAYSLIGTKTATLVNNSYRLGAMYNNFFNVYGGFKTMNWRVGGNPPMSGLCPGTYTYTVFDALGCFATQTVTIGVSTGPGSLLLNGSATSASCATASDGTTTLTPTGGTGPYNYGFSHVFQGGTINQNAFELRNGNFSQGIDLREGTNYNNNNTWDNSIATRRTFSDGGYLLFQASFKFDANADVIFGFTNEGTIDDYTDMLIGFRISNGTGLYAYTNNGGLVPLPGISADTWYDFQIEKTGNTVKFYTRLMNTGSYILRHSRTYSSSRVEYKAAALNFANFYSSNGGYNTKSWNVESVPKTDQLLPGVYTYTITDANGCTATKVLTVLADIDSSIRLSSSLVSGACSNGATGAVLLQPSAGKGAYSGEFKNAFSGNAIQAGLFEVRNGAFVQEGGSLHGEIIPISTAWDNSIATYYTFNDDAKLQFEGAFNFDANTNAYFGFLSNVSAINDPLTVQIGYFISGTQLFVRAGGANVLVGTINANTWYDFKIEKQENVVWFYNRVQGSGSYNLLTIVPYAGSQSIFRFGVLQYGSAGNFGGFYTNNWVINDNPPTSGLPSGTYTYKMYDEAGCYASTTINVPSSNSFSVTAQTQNTSAWNTCDGSVALSSGSGGQLTYAARLYQNVFSGAVLNAGGFVIRNGLFTQQNELVSNNLLNNSGWDNSIATSATFTDNGKLVAEMQMKFSSGTVAYYGIADATSMLNSGNAMMFAFKYVAGDLYAWVSGTATHIGNVPSGLWNSFKVEKIGNVVNFYIRPVQDNLYQLLYSTTSNSAAANYRVGIVHYFAATTADRSYRSRNWNVYGAAADNGLCTGTYTYAVTGDGGCTSDVTFTIGTALALVQTISAPADITVNTDINAAFATGVSLGTPQFAGTPAGITITNDAPAQFPLGTTTVTWTATDASAIVATATQNVTVVDNESPVITAPADLNITLYNGQTSTNSISLGSAAATDNVPGVVTSNNAPSVYYVGSYTIVWTATDAAGNIDTAHQNITIVSVTIPSIAAPADITVPTIAGQSYAIVSNLGTPTLSSNEIPGLTITNNAPSQFPLGATNVTWTVSDNFGNSASAVQVVTIVDVEAPSINAPANILVTTDPDKDFASGVVLGTATVTDNVAATISNNAPAQFPVGITTVTWTATDAAGNTATATQTVTVIDNQAPSISAPANVSATTDLNKDFATNIVLGTPVVIDNVGATVTNDAPAQFNLGETIVTWTATDAAGFTATAYQTVTVTDGQAPSITAPADLNLTTGPGQPYLTNVNLGTPVTSDNATAVTVSNNAPAQFPVGTTTITWTATDAANNSSTATQFVTVTVIAEPPVAKCQAVSVELINGQATVTAAQVNNGSTAAAGIASMTLSRTTFGCNDIGQHQVVLTVTDNNGLSSSCTTVVTVTGNIPSPSIVSIPSTNTFTGGISTNLYIGYGAQSTTLQVNVPVANGPYQYYWSGTQIDNATAAQQLFSPAEAGNYSFAVAVTNSNGCTATSSINICVKDIRVTLANGKKDNKKVYICHIPPGNPANAHTLSVSINAVNAHLQHGDQLGSCNQVCGSSSRPIATVEESFEVKVSPNPTSSYFVMQVKTADKESRIAVRITDAFGRIIQRESVMPGAILKFGDAFANGTYFAEVTQGQEKKVVKLLKL